jgi:hypothetical protein
MEGKTNQQQDGSISKDSPHQLTDRETQTERSMKECMSSVHLLLKILVKNGEWRANNPQ